jgi:hypothetical protein
MTPPSSEGVHEETEWQPRGKYRRKQENSAVKPSIAVAEAVLMLDLSS